jgi:hypothetical protein
MSCADWRWGYFNVYDMASRVLDLDFIVFLGDWIYEYGDDQYPSKAQSEWCLALLRADIRVDAGSCTGYNSLHSDCSCKHYSTPTHPVSTGLLSNASCWPSELFDPQPGTNFGAAKLTQASQPALASTDCARPCHCCACSPCCAATCKMQRLLFYIA